MVGQLTEGPGAVESPPLKGFDPMGGRTGIVRPKIFEK